MITVDPSYWRSPGELLRLLQPAPAPPPPPRNRAEPAALEPESGPAPESEPEAEAEAARDLDLGQKSDPDLAQAGAASPPEPFTSLVGRPRSRPTSEQPSSPVIRWALPRKGGAGACGRAHVSGLWTPSPAAGEGAGAEGQGDTRPPRPPSPVRSSRLKDLHDPPSVHSFDLEDDNSQFTASTQLRGDLDTSSPTRERPPGRANGPGGGPGRELSAIHSSHPAVASADALSARVRTTPRHGRGARRLSPPPSNSATSSAPPLNPSRSSPSGEVVVTRRNGSRLRVISVPRDGNCGFECLARGVTLSPSGQRYTRRDVRRAMRAYVRSNTAAVRELVQAVTAAADPTTGRPPPPPIEAFDRDIMKSGVSGHWLGSHYGIVEIMVAAKAVGASIELYAAERGPASPRAHGPHGPARVVRMYERVENGPGVIRLLFQGRSSAGHFHLLLPAAV
jgi:hypothetical protein